MLEPTHIAFSDESKHNKGRFRSVGVLTTDIQNAQRISEHVSFLLSNSSVQEIKWYKLKSARMRFAAIKIVDYIIDLACKKEVRMDVLRWDTLDSRHCVSRRDDDANLHRMYHHLFRSVFSYRWSDEALWKLIPDENSAINWSDVHYFANIKRTQKNVKHDLFNPEPSVEFLERFQIASVEPCKSENEPLVQVADFFTGMSSYSAEKYENYLRWQDWRTRSLQPRLIEIPISDDSRELSKIDRERCLVLHYFRDKCGKNKLGISLESNQGLRTPRATYPINFWSYTPQHDMDVAPIVA